MIRLKLSDAYCRDAAPGAKNVYIYDLQVTHLALKVTPAGGKSFYYIRSVGGKMRYIRIGPFPAVSVAGARSAALQMDLNAAKGLDLIPDSSVYTLGDCISGYLKNREERKGPSRSLTIPRRRLIYTPASRRTESGKPSPMSPERSPPPEASPPILPQKQKEKSSPPCAMIRK